MSFWGKVIAAALSYRKSVVFHYQKGIIVVPLCDIGKLIGHNYLPDDE